MLDSYKYGCLFYILTNRIASKSQAKNRIKSMVVALHNFSNRKQINNQIANRV